MSLTKQSPTSWRFECMVNGKRFSKTYKAFGETKRQVEKKFMEWKVECNYCVKPAPTYTFEKFADVWLTEYCKDYSPLVIKNYRCNLKNWILPRLGNFKIDEITPLVLDSFVSQLKSSNNLINGQANLSNGSISKIYSIVRAIITTAYTKDIIQRNPCSKVKLEFKRDVSSKTAHCYDTETYRRMLDLITKDTSDNARVIEFAIKTGLRRSEIWGVTWNDIDLENLVLSVNKTLQKVNNKMVILPCKTASSVRTISIPGSLVPMLKKYKQTHPTNIYVFQNLDYDAVTKWFRDWQPRHNIPKIRFHDLRHTHASLLLYLGIDIKTISERLGHSNIGITMNTYTHVLKELDTKAAKAIDEIA